MANDAKKVRIGMFEILDILNLKAPGPRGISVAEIVRRQCWHSNEMGPEPAYLIEIDGSYVDIYEVEGEPMSITIRYGSDEDTPQAAPNEALTMYFMTVEWCSDSHRGVFCSKDGTPFRKNGEPHTEEEMDSLLGPFCLILSARSEPFTEEEIAEYTYFRPLAEYENQYGIAIREAQVPKKDHAPEQQEEEPA